MQIVSLVFVQSEFRICFIIFISYGFNLHHLCSTETKVLTFRMISPASLSPNLPPSPASVPLAPARVFHVFRRASRMQWQHDSAPSVHRTRQTHRLHPESLRTRHLPVLSAGAYSSPLKCSDWWFAWRTVGFLLVWESATLDEASGWIWQSPARWISALDGFQL